MENERPLTLPIDVLVGESPEVVNFVRKYWEPSGGRPGLKDAGAKLQRTIDEEILSLRGAVQEAQTAYLLIVEPKPASAGAIERAKFVLGEVTATLDWLLDDEVVEDADAQFAQVKAAHRDDTDGADNLAQALHDYATIAKPLVSRMAAVGGFNPELVDEAFRLASELGEVRQTPAPASAKSEEARRVRNGLALLLQDRVALVRAAARFVFRRHPEVVREATSAYERRRRAESRRRATAKNAAVKEPVGL
jgi:hypothetical protein